MYNSRTTLSQAVLPQVKQHMSVFQTTIPRSVIVEEAHLLKQDLFTYASKHKVTSAYQNYVKKYIIMKDKENKKMSNSKKGKKDLFAEAAKENLNTTNIMGDFISSKKQEKNELPDHQENVETPLWDKIRIKSK